jgi:hypothetical protein
LFELLDEALEAAISRLSGRCDLADG